MLYELPPLYGSYPNPTLHIHAFSKPDDYAGPPGFLFVEETADVASFVASQNVAFLVDAEGKRLSVCAEKAELAAEFAHLLK